MKRLLIVFVLLGFLSVSIASDLDDGRAALERGDHAAALRLLRPLAEDGDPQAQHLLGAMFMSGMGVTQDLAESARWFRGAAEADVAEAQTVLGYLYMQGAGVEQDLQEAVRWFERAAAAGEVDAQQNLGALAVSTQDYASALKWFRAAAAQGNAEAEKNLGLMHQFGWGVEKDVTEAMRLYRRSAEAGNTDAMAGLGGLYETGEDVAEDPLQAFRWFHAAADRGHTGAQSRLAMMYGVPIGVERSKVEAHRWLLLSSSDGDAPTFEALENHAELLSEEQIEQAKTLARQWTPFEGSLEESLARADAAIARSGAQAEDELVQLAQQVFQEEFPGLPSPGDESITRMAAEDGVAWAQLNLGQMYARGDGVEQDVAAAAEWYRKAADQGHFEAEAELGRLYESGRGVERDDAEAARWYERSAEAGFPPAQHRFGLMRLGGRGTTQSFVEAYKWLRLAEQAGFPDPEGTLALLAGKMTPEQSDEAERLIREYRERAERAKWPASGATQGLDPAQQAGVTPPKRLEGAAPVYPELARVGRIEARILLNAVIDVQGRARVESLADCIATDSSGLGRLGALVSQEPGAGLCPLFENAATDAVSRWRFSPATKDGEPVEVFYTLLIDFRLE